MASKKTIEKVVAKLTDDECLILQRARDWNYGVEGQPGWKKAKSLFKMKDDEGRPVMHNEDGTYFDQLIAERFGEP